MIRWIVLVAGLLGAAGVVLGSFVAHGLSEYLAQQSIGPDEVSKRLAQCDIGVRYQLWHAIAMLAVGLAPSQLAPKRRVAAAIFMLLGILHFSGGLSSMSILGITGHWAIVPSGGAMLIAGWLFVTSIALAGQARSSSEVCQ